jgi:GT2 family glycosyltransferase
MTQISNKDITFVITTFKSGKIIDSCIDCLPPESKKIIVENGSDIALKNNLENKYKNLECYVTGKNLGYGKANNFGIKNSKTRYIFILNPDAHILDNTMRDMTKNLYNINFAIAAPYSKDDIEMETFEDQTIIEQDYIKGFAMLIDKKEIENIGFFDENFFLYMEEIDLCKRVRFNGKKIFLIKTEIYHKGGVSHGDKEDFEMEKSRNWHWMWSKFYYNKKHYGYFKALISTFPIFLSAGFKFLFYSLVNNNKKKITYLMRFKGLLNSYLMSDAFYRPYE